VNRSVRALKYKIPEKTRLSVTCQPPGRPREQARSVPGMLLRLKGHTPDLINLVISLGLRLRARLQLDLSSNRAMAPALFSGRSERDTRYSAAKPVFCSPAFARLPISFTAAPSTMAYALHRPRPCLQGLCLPLPLPEAPPYWGPPCDRSFRAAHGIDAAWGPGKRCCEALSNCCVNVCCDAPTGRAGACMVDISVYATDLSTVSLGPGQYGGSTQQRLLLHT
jgi:hypothetical protein